MESLLFLAHRLPFPPNKGDKVRSYHFLRHLAGRYRVFLGTFVDDPDDWRHVEAVRGLCAGMHAEPLVPWSKRLVSTAGLVRREALTLGYFRSRNLHKWVKDVVVRERIAHAFAFSSPMAQYALGLAGVRCIVDIVDMDSAKWAEYARRRPWPISALYEREAARLLDYERQITTHADASMFVTRAEAKLFCDAAPECASRVATVGNGVDSEYFAPSPDCRSPFAPGERPIVFTGAMDYWPNIDAVSWFAREVMPEIRRSDSLARFYIVGMNPDSAVLALANDPAVVVTGRVEDIRPYLQHANVIVAPLRVARGIQNKVLEAMAMARPVVVTPPVVAGLDARHRAELCVASDARGFAGAVLELMDTQRATDMGNLARLRILADYTWAASYARLDELLERGGATARTAGRVLTAGARCPLAAS